MAVSVQVLDNDRNEQLILFNYDNAVQTYWAKILTAFDQNGYFVPLQLTRDQQEITVGYFQPEATIGSEGDMFFSALDFTTGATRWHKKIWTQETPRLLPAALAPTPGGETLFAARLQDPISSANNLHIGKLDSMGHPTIGIRILDDQPFDWGSHSPPYGKVHIYTDKAGNTYLTGKIRISEEIIDFGNFGEFPESDACVVKLDTALNVVWAKQLTVENFSVVAFTTAVSNDGQTTLSIATGGSFPIISARFDTDGNLLYQRGYDLNLNILESGDEGELYILETKVDFINLEYLTTLAKTLPDGTLPACTHLPACVAVRDLSLSVAPVTWQTEDAPDFEDFEVIIGDTEITSEDYCAPLPFPTPTFSLPDTVCQATCLRPEGLNNDLANHVEWRISGPGVDTLVADTTFNWCFDAPGTFYIEHSVWVLGCADLLTHTLTVLPDDLVPPLGADTVACAFPFVPPLRSSRPLRSVVWDTGAARLDVVLPAAGTYSVLASDGYCSVRDTFTVGDIRTAFPLPWLAVRDTAVCADQLPFTLAPNSPHTQQLTLDGVAFEDEVRLSTAGTYRIGLQLDHCPAEAPFTLTIDDCATRFYLPNAFSPNADGANDRLFPQGTDFELRRFQVFDRWGALVFDATTPDAAWDGKHNGKPAGAGVYAVVLEIFNTRNLAVETFAQNVMLVR